LPEISDVVELRNRRSDTVRVEYMAAVTEADYHAFKLLVSTTLPREYDMWLRVRERGKSRAIRERDALVVEVEVRPEEFGAYCKSLKRRDFSITALDRCAGQKGTAQDRRPDAFASGIASRR
jgi:hypothetical protein